MSETSSIGDDIKVLSGFAFSSAGFSQLEGMPLIRIRDLASASTEIRFKGAFDPAYLIRPGDILIGMDGDFEVHRWCGNEALLNQRVCKVETASHAVDQQFLYWFLKPQVAAIHRRTPQTTVRHLSAKDLHGIPIPPIGAIEQAAVGQVLDTLDTAIQRTEAIITKLKAVKQGLLHDLLTRGIDANGELRPPQIEAPHLYKSSPLGWIPMEWDTPTLALACSLIRDGTHLPPVRVEEGPLLLSVRNMQGGQFVLTDQDTRVSDTFYRQMHKSWEVQKGDVLLAIVGATIGKTAMVGDMPKFTLQRSVAVLRGRPDQLRNEFLHLYLGSPEFQASLWAQVNQTAQPGIYLDQLGNIALRAPPPTEQEEVQLRMQAAQRRIDKESDTLLKLRKQKSGLMDDLLTGRVRVTPLLEQIAP